MELVVNGESRPCQASTVDELIDALGLPRERVAVELNGELVPRAARAHMRLKDGDRLEIVTLVGGG